MPQNDCAIVVGIARYRDSQSFPTLKGPINDVSNVKNWLLSRTGGDVPAANVRTLVTAPALLALPETAPLNVTWAPTFPEFQAELDSLIRAPNGEFISRANARLYLYFSGHGYTNGRWDMPSAALWGADAWQMTSPANLPGTLFAQAVAKLALFGQIVLIMDCCRDLSATAPYGVPVLPDVTADGAERVSVLSVYAVPKDGKAQESVLPDTTGQTVGLMTHALFTGINEMPPDILGRVSADALSNYVAMKWTKWYSGSTAPPVPRIYPPTTAQTPIFFSSGRDLIDQEFSVPANRTTGFELSLLSVGNLAEIHAAFDTDSVEWQRDTDAASQVTIPLSTPDTGGRQTFTLRLLRVPYVVNYLSGPPSGTLTFTPGNSRVNL